MRMVVTSVADIWTKPSTDSERDSQLIFGESVEILDEEGIFSKVRSLDGVVGFIKSAILGDWSARHYKLSHQVRNKKMSFPFGSYLSRDDVENFKIPKRYVRPIEEIFNPIKLTKMFVGIPYLWGGTSDFGFDCSGFTQRLFRYSGTEIPRNSDQQQKASDTVSDFQSALPGDLVFFKGHVAFHLGRGRIVHANGHYSRVTETDLFDDSSYSRELLNIMEKIGRFELKSV